MQTKRFSAHRDRVNAVCFTPNGRFCVSGGNDGAVCVHDLHDGRLVCRLEGHTGSVNDVAVTPNGKHLVSASSDGTVRVWHAASGREVACLSSPRGAADDLIRCVEVSADGRHLVAGANDLLIWQLPNLTLSHCLKPFFYVHDAVILPDSRSVMVGGERRIPICTIDLRSGRTVEVRPDAAKSAGPLAVSPDGRLAAAWTDGGGIEVWRRRGGSVLFQCDDYAYALSFTMDGNYLLAANDRSVITAFEAESGTVIARLPFPHQPTCLAVSDDGGWILVGCRDGGVTLANLADALTGRLSDS